MFDVRKVDENILDEILITSLNNMFNTLKNSPLKTFKDLVDQKLLLSMCLELDENLFSDCSFLGEKSSGIFYSEVKEIISKIIFSLKKAGLNFREDFKNLERLNISQLITYNKEETFKLVELLIVYSCNCPYKGEIIDIISSFEEYVCSEILRIIDRYINVDEDTRKSMISSRSTIKRESLTLEQEIAMRYLNKIEILEKEKEKLEDEKSNFKCQLNNLEVDAENSEKENKKNLSKIKALEEQNNKFEIENRELKKINNDLDIQLKRINQINKDNSLVEKYRIKLDEKELELSQVITKTKELEQLASNNKKAYEENVYQLKNTIISLQDYKDKYEKISEKLKEHQFNTEKLDSLETVYKDYQSLTKKYNALVQENENLHSQKENLDKLLKELEEKLDENNKNLEMLKSKTLEGVSNIGGFNNQLSNTILKYQDQIHESAPNKLINLNELSNSEISDFKLKSAESQKNSSNFESLGNNLLEKKGSLNVNERKEIKVLKEENQFLKELIEQKEYEINELNSIIKMLEEKQADFIQQSEEQVNETEILKKTISLKEDTIRELNESINALNEKINLFQNEIHNLNDRSNFEHNKKLEEFDLLKKENLETKDRYEKEFELIASSIYNLGLNYWSLKLSTSNELNEKPSWLKRERKKYYDGDI